MLRKKTRLACLLASCSLPAFADDVFTADTNEPAYILGQITVTGAAGGIENVAGSITVLAPEDLDVQVQTDILRILRAVPGVNIQEEEGFGLRPNIGLRGSGSDRSARIALMEDGVPVAPAAYAAPAAYYFPSAGRIHAIEVTKGPAVIRYGPRTTGGAINLISTPIPYSSAGKAEAFLGDFNRQRVHAWTGTRLTVADGLEIGGLIETFNDKSDGFKVYDNGADTGFDVDDIVAKFGLYADNGAHPWSAELKYQTRDETSNQTYLGLTDADFAANPNRLYDSGSQDVMTNRNELFQLTHQIDMSADLSLTTIIYRTNFNRNWYKLQGVNAAGGGAAGDVGLTSILNDPVTYAAELNLLRGVTSIDDSLVIRENKRKYFGQGIQSILNYDTDLLGAAHDLTLGIRWHNDEEDRFQKEDAYRLQDGTMILTTGGAAGSQSNRVSTGGALAVFVEDRIELGAWQVTGGLRFENYELIRDDFSTSDPARANGPARTRKNTDTILLPAISILYAASNQLDLLAGVHRGFAIPGPGNTASSAEESVNWEAGGRYDNGYLNLEAIAFFNDYSNLLGTVTGSTGGGGNIGDQFDGGDVDVKGLEFSASWDASSTLETGHLELPVSLVYTYTRAEFKTGFDSDYGPWGEVQRGDQLPYIPVHQLTISGGVNTERWGLNTTANYVSEARASAGQGTIPLNQLIDARWVFDASAYVQITDGFRLKARVENLFDETYAAARTPAGLGPGKPREAMIGFELSF